MGTTRFIDRLLAGQAIEFPRWMDKYEASEREYADALRKLLAETVVFDVTNVADYFYTNHKSWRIDEFTNLAPPFNNFWMEMERPAEARGPFANEDIHRRAQAAGVLFQIYDKEALEAEHPDYAATWLANIGTEKYARVRWICQAQIFLDWNGLVLGPCGVWHYCIEQDFRCYGVDPQHYTDDAKTMLIWREAMPTLQPILWACFLAQWLLHCQNIKTIECVPQELQPKIARAYLRRRKRPLLTFKRLVIEPMKRAVKKAGAENADETSSAQALHVIRGHTKTYGPDKPLFGKWTGTWFWPSHDAGTDTAHQIQKDYAVKGASQL